MLKIIIDAMDTIKTESKIKLLRNRRIAGQ